MLISSRTGTIKQSVELPVFCDAIFAHLRHFNCSLTTLYVDKYCHLSFHGQLLLLCVCGHVLVPMVSVLQTPGSETIPAYKESRNGKPQQSAAFLRNSHICTQFDE